MIKIQRVLHAGYIFETPKAKIFVDPILEDPFCGNCYSFPLVSLDPEWIVRTFEGNAATGSIQKAIFISHIHEDHLSSRSLHYFSRQIPIYLYSSDPRYFIFLREMGFSEVHSIELGRSYDFSGLRIQAVKALDENLDSIFVIEDREVRILNLVDSWIHPDSEQFLFQNKWDLVLWPFQVFREWEVLAPDWIKGAKSRDLSYPEELLQSLKTLPFAAIVPSSCQFQQESWWRLRPLFFSESYASFANRLKNQGQQASCFRLDPGHSLEWAGDRWIRGESHVAIQSLSPSDQNGGPFEEDYLPAVLSECSDQTVQEISSFLPRLGSKQREIVENFFEFEIFKIWNEGGIETEGFFCEDRLWQVLIWEKGDLALGYQFKTSATGLKLLSNLKSGGGEVFPQQTDWLTEIPLVKISSAIESRELLNSLFLQVNRKGSHLNPVLWDKEWDVLEDPLIQWLSSQDPLKYQRALLQSL